MKRSRLTPPKRLTEMIDQYKKDLTDEQMRQFLALEAEFIHWFSDAIHKK